MLRVIHDAGLDHRWLHIAQTLTVLSNDLTGFERRFHGDPSLCLLHAMAAWLRGQKRLSDPPSWWRLVRAVADPRGGGNRRQAMKIAANFRGAYNKTTILSLFIT